MKWVSVLGIEAAYKVHHNTLIYDNVCNNMLPYSDGIERCVDR